MVNADMWPKKLEQTKRSTVASFALGAELTDRRAKAGISSTGFS